MSPPAPAWIDAPDDAVCCVGAQPRTFAQLRRDVAALARHLGPPGPIERALLCQDRYGMAVGLLACWSRGETVVLPLNHAPEVLSALARAMPLLHDGVHPEGVDLSAWLDQPQGPAPALCPPPTDRVVVRLSTSGSTGEVQLHDKTGGQLLREVAVLGATFGVTQADRVVATIPPHHIYGLLFTILLPLTHGAAFHHDSPLFVEAVQARLREVGATVLVSVPAHLRGLQGAGDAAFADLRRIFSSGAPLPEATAHAFAQTLGCRVTEVFGSTETGGIAWRCRPDRETWRPLPGVQVTADDEGRLQLTSPFLPPDAPPVHTGDDRVEVLPDGTFRHLGRVDDVVKIASKRVALRAVEHTLLALEGVEDAVVVPRTLPNGRTRLEALVVSAGPDVPTMRRWLAQHFDQVAVPRIHLVARLPRTPHGKLRHADVLALLTGPSPVPTTASVPVHLPADHPAFEGHFPGEPVFPAVAQLHDLVLPQVHRTWPDLGACIRMSRVKFSAVLAPGDDVQVDLTRAEGAHTVRFTLRRDTTVCSSGQLHHAPSTPDAP